ncbi:MAG: hypothetical protein IJU09_02165, partial [Phyllobacterium sp.]|nr:hypothetical protein [Phyllobacterium sp.]
MHISYEIDADVPLQERLRFAGLRPTRQRVALASLIFAKGDRHLSAEELHEEALGAKLSRVYRGYNEAIHDER